MAILIICYKRLHDKFVFNLWGGNRKTLRSVKVKVKDLSLPIMITSICLPSGSDDIKHTKKAGRKEERNVMPRHG